MGHPSHLHSVIGQSVIAIRQSVIGHSAKENNCAKNELFRGIALSRCPISRR
jgi:hypothetical protein